MSDDPFIRLRPEPQTPEDELCHCIGDVPLLFFYAFSSNPVYCAHCKGQIPPERVGWTSKEVDDIAGWRDVADAITQLWLDSREYESWAKQEQESIDSALNRRSRALCENLSTKHDCYWVYTRSDENDTPIQVAMCPACGAALAPLESQTRKHPLVIVCHPCRIATWHEGMRGWQKPTVSS